MNFLKNIIRMTVVALAAMVATACDKVSPEKDTDKSAEKSIVFLVDVDNITATSAKVKVSHDGKTSDSWYGYLSPYVEVNDLALINDAVATLKNGGDLSSSLIFSKNYTKILPDLAPNTTYKYIAFGLTEDGVVYGEHASVEFTTLSGNSDGGNNDGGNNDGGSDEVYENMIVNPNWSVAYTGKGVIGESNCNHTVTVNSSDNNPYTIAVVSASDFSVENLKVSSEELAADMVEYVQQYNQATDPDITLEDLLFRGNAKNAFEDLEYYPGYYKAVAIGITSNGVVSGLYAVSPTFEIKEETPTSLFSSWLGNWVIRGDNNVTNDVTISKVVANKVVVLTGLMGLDLPIYGEYSVDRNDIIFSAQLVMEGAQFDEAKGNIYLVGLDKDGHFYSLDKGGYPIVIAGVMESEATGTQRALVRYGVNDIDYPEFVAMMFVGQINGEYWSLDIYDENDPSATTIPSFNIMAEINAPESAATTLSPMRLFRGTSRVAPINPKFVLGKKVEPKRF